MFRDPRNVVPSKIQVTQTQRLNLPSQCNSVPSFYCLSSWHQNVTITETLLQKRTWKKRGVILRVGLPLISTDKSNLNFNAVFTACRLQHKCILGNMQCACLHLCILYNQRDATYTMFFIIISAVHVSGGFSAHHQELIKLYVQP